MVLAPLMAALLASITVPAGLPGPREVIDTPAVRLDLAQVRARIAAGSGDSLPDLSHADLSGLDLHGIDFRRANLTGARLAMIAHAGHLTNLEQPQEFNRIVEQFIAQVRR